MKKTIVLLLSAACILGLCACDGEKQEVPAEAPTVESTDVSEEENADVPEVESVDATAAESAEDALVGIYEDSISQRATMEIRAGEEGKYEVIIEWPDSADQVDVWTLEATSDGKKLTYESGTHCRLTFGDDGSEKDSEMINESPSGEFVINDDGSLTWTGTDASEEGTFVKNE